MPHCACQPTLELTPRPLATLKKQRPETITVVTSDERRYEPSLQR
ncbi:hypothetical protein T07_4096 [Trichinella nelsoni]|uniref:Uncharacterized protein n=1 Tax=Trichinella nelsoni TaxID=6336 RepID=A0A0V0RZE7_9BILA|nr:hypothetical protein T07_4096 [Trichinella nelsoni]